MAANDIPFNELGGGKPAFRWAEYVGERAPYPMTAQFAEGSSQVSSVIDVPWEDLADSDSITSFLPNILGYSYVDTSNRLRRVLPWQCPYPWYWLWCVGVNNLHGVKLEGKSGSGLLTNPPSPTLGVASGFDRGRMTVTWGTLPYDVISDADIDAKPYLGDESYRFVDKQILTNAEYVSLNAGFFRFKEGPPGPPQGQGGLGQRFNLGTTKILVKADLSWTWHNVPTDYIFLSNGIPSSIYKGLGKVNDSLIWGYEAGTLLAMPPVFTPVTQPVAPRLILQNANLGSTPRAWNIQFLFKFWDPPLGTDGPIVPTTHGWNTALWTPDMLYYKIKSEGSTVPSVAGRDLFEDYNFNLFFQKAIP